MIGIDFDNTIAAYDAVFHETVVERGLLQAPVPTVKTAIRDAVRRRPQGELEWQRLQAEVYGPRMSRACIVEGVREFLCTCRLRGVPVSVVSHKTQYARRDETGTDLRAASLRWMEAQGLFSVDTGLRRTDVFFEDTRQNKLERIRVQGCSHFVDDLVEVFLEDGFPPAVTKILLAPHGESPPVGVTAVTCWAAVGGVIHGG